MTVARRVGADHTEVAIHFPLPEPSVAYERTMSRLAANGLRLGFLVLAFATWWWVLTVRSVEIAQPAILALVLTALTGVPATIWGSLGLAKIRRNSGHLGQQAVAAAGLAIGLFLIGVASLYLLSGLTFLQFLQENGD